jgi:hypothetical protein
MSSGKSISKLFHEKLYTFWRDYASIDEIRGTRTMDYLLANEIGDPKPRNCQIQLEVIFKEIFKVFFGENIDLNDDPPAEVSGCTFLSVDRPQILKFISQVRNLKSQCGANFENILYTNEFYEIAFTRFDKHLEGIILALTQMSQDPTFTHEIPQEAVMKLLMRLQNFVISKEM